MSRAERAGRWALYAAMTLVGGWLLWRGGHPHYAFETDDVNKAMGHWSLRLLWACLLLTPLSRALRQPMLRRWRRPLGLGAFGFATLHTVHFLLWGRLWPDRLGLMFAPGRPYTVKGLGGAPPADLSDRRPVAGARGDVLRPPEGRGGPGRPAGPGLRDRQADPL